MKKIAMFVFNDDPMCFIHVLLNTLDLDEKGHEIKIIIEGGATKLIPELNKGNNPMHHLWGKVKNFGLVEGVCRACSKKMGTSDAAKAQELTLLDEMSGHPSIGQYQDEGFEVMIF